MKTPQESEAVEEVMFKTTSDVTPPHLPGGLWVNIPQELPMCIVTLSITGKLQNQQCTSTDGQKMWPTYLTEICSATRKNTIMSVTRNGCNEDHRIKQNTSDTDRQIACFLSFTDPILCKKKNHFL